MEKRETKITLRLSVGEHEQIRAAAFAARLAIAEFTRRAALGVEIRPAAPTAPTVNREVYADLSRLAANFNQVAKHLNDGRERVGSELAGQVLGQLLEVSEQLALLRAQLLGEGSE